MSIIVRDDGFHQDTWQRDGGTFIDLEKFGQDVAEKNAAKTALDVPNDAHIETLPKLFENVAMIRIPFPGFADGRGFSLAMKLRQLGFKGTLRAVGHVIADQYGHARKCGFDEVEIDEEMSRRQPEEQWLERAPRTGTGYQDRLLEPRELRNF